VPGKLPNASQGLESGPRRTPCQGKVRPMPSVRRQHLSSHQPAASRSESEACPGRRKPLHAQTERAKLQPSATRPALSPWGLTARHTQSLNGGWGYLERDEASRQCAGQAPIRAGRWRTCGSPDAPTRWPLAGVHRVLRAATPGSAQLVWAHVPRLPSSHPSMTTSTMHPDSFYLKPLPLRGSAVGHPTKAKRALPA
jgi:hypothetical protein